MVNRKGKTIVKIRGHPSLLIGKDESCEWLVE